MLLYIFNPDHDLALANNEAHYMPPDSAKKMATDLALLPVWFAQEDGFVLAPSAYNEGYLQEMTRRFPLPLSLLTAAELSRKDFLGVRVWGWNRALRKRLLGLSVAEMVLPSEAEIACWRKHAHRNQAVKLLSCFKDEAWLCGESEMLISEDACRRFVDSHAFSVLKSPLSGSGKGLNWAKGEFTPLIAGWCKRVLRQQGGVVGEPVYEKVVDGAMEFYADGSGTVSFIGYSQFTTSPSGAYLSNLLQSDEQLEEAWSTYIPLDVLQGVRRRLEKELSALLGHHYVGYLGIDQMVCRFDEAPYYRLHPCVEMNLRMNMGVLARLFTDRYLCSEAKGEFKISYYEADDLAFVQHETMEKRYPLVVEQGCIRSGYLALTPVVSSTRYVAWVLVGYCP